MRAAVEHTIAAISESHWRRLAGEGVDRGWAYLRFRELVEPGRAVVVVGHDGSGPAAALHGALTTSGTGLFSHPWKMLAGEQFLRLDKAAEDTDAVLERQRRLVSKAAGSEAAGLDEALGPVLTVRGFDDSAVLLRESADREAATATVVRAAQDAVRAGLAGAIAFPFVEPGNRVLRRVLTAAGFRHAVLTATTEFDLTRFDSYEAMLASMRRKRRYRFLSERRAVEEGGFGLGTADLADAAERVAELEAGNTRRYGGSPNPESLLRTRKRMAALLGDHVRVPTVTRGEGEVIACGLHLVDRWSYSNLVYGCDYTVADRGTAYQCVNFYDPLEYAFSRGLGRLRMGFEAFEPKLIRGARLAPRESWIWTPDERIGTRIGRLLSFMGERSGPYLDDLARRHRAV